MARTQSQQGVPTPRVMCVPAVGPDDGTSEAGSGRVVRSAAVSRLGRLLVLGGLLVVGWVLGVFLGWAGAAPADAQARDSVHHTTVVLSQGVHDAAVTSAEGAEGSADVGGLPAGHGSAQADELVGTGRAGIQAHRGDRRVADDHALRRDVADSAPAGGAATGIASADIASATAAAMAGRGVDGLTSQSTPVLPAPSTVEHTAGASGLAPQPGGGGSGPFGPGFGDVVRSIDDPRLMVLPAPLAAVLPPVVRTAADDPSFSPD